MLSEQATVLPPEEARWLWFAGWVALNLWDDETWTLLSTRQLELVREAGALTALPFVLTNRSSVYAFFGELATAASLAAGDYEPSPRRPGSPRLPTVRSRSPLCAVARPSFRS